LNLLEKAKQLVQDYTLCDHCLGRQFSDISTGTTNQKRGITIRKLLINDAITQSDNPDFLFEEALSKSGSIIVEDTLKKSEKTTEEATPCYLCQDLLKLANHLVDIIEPELKDIEFQTFLMGTTLTKEFWERERELKGEIEVLQTEYLKQEFNRIVGKKLAKRMSITTDFDSPEVVVEIDPITLKFNIKVKPLYIYGRYLKFIRTIPQTRWPCFKCKGKGCEQCNNTGKRYQESVEELMENKIILTAKSSKGVLHGAGREDIDALMLGNGRPFVFEVITPQIRTIDLKKLQEEVNSYCKGKIEVRELRWSSKNEVRNLKGSAETTVKKYRAKVSFEEDVEDKTMDEIERFFVNKSIDQRTPNRVAHRRADKIRKKKVFSVECTQTSKRNIEAIITCDGGCYVKELISGDEGRTNPSISQIAHNQAICEELDVLEVRKNIET